VALPADSYTSSWGMLLLLLLLLLPLPLLPV
jgi:hypothetical protein